MSDETIPEQPLVKPVEKSKLEFTGTWRELMPIIWTNLFFNIITLSHYRFWGRTKVRKYLWSNVTFKEDPFEYTGTGKELFFGFVIVLLAVFAPLYALFLWVQTIMITNPPLGFSLLALGYIILLYLSGVALYRAQKYRLSRTRWRGIRGAMENNGYMYGLKFIGFIFLNIITLGLAAPYSANKLWTIETNARRFGSAEFTYNGRSADFYVHFLASIGLGFIGFLVLAFILGALGGVIGFDDVSTVTEPSVAEQISMFFSAIFIYVIVGLVMTMIYVIYEFKKLQVFWNASQIEGNNFVFNGTGGGLFKMIVGNFFIDVFSIGILHPITQLRWMRYFADNLEVHGDLDLETISQREGKAMKYGEGLAEGFDFGGI